MNQEKSRLIAFLGALCLFLSTIEYVIPKPLPFMRLGLANLPILIALYLLDAKSIFFLVLLKVIAQGFVTGSFFSYIFLFSLLGSFSSGITMFAFSRISKKNISPVGISLAGSIANSGMQILLSKYILFGEAISYVAPVLLVNGTITGILLGLAGSFFMSKSQWFKKVEVLHENL